MVNAKITFPDGTQIDVEGTAEDIVKIKQRFDEKNDALKNKDTPNKKTGQRIHSSKGPLGRVRLLIERNFFEQKRTLQDVKSKLEEMAIFYRLSDLSPSLIRLVKRGELRRLKEKNQWRYVNP